MTTESHGRAHLRNRIACPLGSLLDRHDDHRDRRGLLEFEKGLEGLTKRVPGEEVLTFAKFLLLTAVILPIVPNRSLRFASDSIRSKPGWSSLRLAPFRMAATPARKSPSRAAAYFFSAVLGGAILPRLPQSSCRSARRTAWATASISGTRYLVASGMMYLRLLALIAIFSIATFPLRLRWPFLLLAGTRHVRRLRLGGRSPNQ